MAMDIKGFVVIEAGRYEAGVELAKVTIVGPFVTEGEAEIFGRERAIRQEDEWGETPEWNVRPLVPSRLPAAPVMLVYRNDSRVFGPFESVEVAYAWAKAVPNALFETWDQWEHAEGNSDFWATGLSSP